MSYKRLAFSLVALALLAAHRRPATIVFVCEHGAAKSVVAAAEFNRLAKERGINAVAVARGTTPQAEISPAAAKGLAAEGLPVPRHPVALSERDTASAARVVAFCELPAYASRAHVEKWQDVPAVGDGYAAARDVILRHINVLLDELAR